MRDVSEVDIVGLTTDHCVRAPHWTPCGRVPRPSCSSLTAGVRRDHRGCGGQALRAAGGNAGRPRSWRTDHPRRNPRGRRGAEGRPHCRIAQCGRPLLTRTGSRAPSVPRDLLGHVRVGGADVGSGQVAETRECLRGGRGRAEPGPESNGRRTPYKSDAFSRAWMAWSNKSSASDQRPSSA
jgi:hypothetical protein